MLRSMLLLVGIMLAGCGPIMFPAGYRLPDEEQWEVDNAWEQAMNPPELLGREDLLTFLISHGSHVLGVDRFSFRSEKDLPRGKAIMTVEFDVATPGDGEFSFEYRNLAGQVLRRETYSGEEVLLTVKALAEPPPQAR